MTEFDKAQHKAFAKVGDRQHQLRQILVQMVRSPESVKLKSLITAYQEAELGEVNFAADTLTALYLRSALDIRRRLRVVLSAAIQEQPSAALGLALTARLGALVMPVVPPSS